MYFDPVQQRHHDGVFFAGIVDDDDVQGVAIFEL
jgi:hypothetical protein